MNKALLTGRLTRDADIRRTSNENGEVVIARGTIACDDRPKKDGTQVTQFPSIVAFGRQADFLEKYGKQGVKFEVEGRIVTGSYTNKDGNKVYTTDVAVEAIRFAEKKSAGTGAAAPAEAAAPAPATGGIATDDEGFLVADDDFELPFN
jgi:single-strand DNA-binding protein